jgi:O-antigen/teichoic acid export membrane protein
MATDSAHEFVFADYFATRALGSALAVLVIAAIAVAGGRDLASIALILLIAGYKTAEALSDVFYGVLQQDEQMEPIARAVSARGIAAVACMTLALLLAENIVIGASCILAAWVAILLAHDYPAARARLGGPLFVPRPKIWRVVLACYPLGVTMGLLSLRINVPVYFIEAQFGAQEVGYYSAIAYFLVAGNLVTGSLLQTAAPRLAHYHRARDTRAFSRFLARLMLVGGGIGLAGLVGATLLGRWILGAMYGPSYAAHHDVLIWIMVAAMAGNMSQFMGLSLTVSRLFRYHVLVQGLGVTVVAGLSWILVPWQGIVGGAKALAAATAITLLCTVVVTRAKVLPGIRFSGTGFASMKGESRTH